MQKFANVTVKFNGQYVTSLSNESTYSLKVKPGKHTLSSKGNSFDMKEGCSQILSLAPGEIQYVSIEPSSSGAVLPIISILTNPLVCKFEIEEVTKAVGMQEYAAITQ